jgi:hypothetical protein
VDPEDYYSGIVTVETATGEIIPLQKKSQIDMHPLIPIKGLSCGRG